MTKSQLIIDIVTDKIRIDEGLFRLSIVSTELENTDLNNWIKYELEGYPKNADLPKYRENIGVKTTYSGINGSFQVTNVPLSLGLIPEELRSVFFKNDYRENITISEEILSNENNMAIDQTGFAPLIYKHSGVQCYQITTTISKISIRTIVNSTKRRLIEVLQNLEREYGTLDSFDIEVTKHTPEKTSEINKTLTEVIYSDGKEENY